MKKFLQEINLLQQKNLYRKLAVVDFYDETTITKESKKLISFASNDYFSLANNQKVKNSAIQAIQKFGVGAKSSRYICGNNSLNSKLEKAIAKINNCEDAIIFSSGYQAAIGAIPALVSESDLIIADKLIHSCLLDGSKLSDAKFLRFSHNDTKHLEKLLQENRAKYQNCLIISEEIFSMDGDLAHIDELLQISKKFDCKILIDGAHSLYQKEKLIQNSRLIKFGTFSKAFGSFGGYVCADKITIDYLRNSCKSAIYTTALPPSILAASIQSCAIISKKDFATKTLENANYFCELMNLQKTNSAIVIIKINDAKTVLQIAKNIEEKGFLISAIRPPTALESRLRITFCYHHKKSEIKKLAQILKAEIAEICN